MPMSTPKIDVIFKLGWLSYNDCCCENVDILTSTKHHSSVQQIPNAFSSVVNHIASGQMSTTYFCVLYKQLHPTQTPLMFQWGVKAPQGSSSILQDESMCPCWPCLRQPAVSSARGLERKLAKRAFLAPLSQLSLGLSGDLELQQ